MVHMGFARIRGTLWGIPIKTITVVGLMVGPLISGNPTFLALLVQWIGQVVLNMMNMPLASRRVFRCYL